MLQLLPFIVHCSENNFHDFSAPKKEVAALASRKLQESLISLEKRTRSLEQIHYEIVNADLMVGITRSLYDVQMDFVERLESFHQQIYASLSCFAYYLQFYLSPLGPNASQLNSVSRFLKYLYGICKDPVKNDLLPLLEKSRVFRSEHVDHPFQNGGIFDFGTAAFAGRAVAFFFTTKLNAEIPEKFIPTESTGMHAPKDQTPTNTEIFKDNEGIVTYDEETLRKMYPWIDACYIPPHHRDVFLAIKAVIGQVLENNLKIPQSQTDEK